MSAPITCRHCGEIFDWTDTPEGKRPLNRGDGLPHWRTCIDFRKQGRKKWKAAKKRAAIQARRDKLSCPPVKVAGEHFRQVESKALPWEEEPINDAVDRLLLLAEQA